MSHDSHVGGVDREEFIDMFTAKLQDDGGGCLRLGNGLVNMLSLIEAVLRPVVSVIFDGVDLGSSCGKDCWQTMKIRRAGCVWLGAACSMAHS